VLSVLHISIKLNIMVHYVIVMFHMFILKITKRRARECQNLQMSDYIILILHSPVLTI